MRFVNPYDPFRPKNNLTNIRASKVANIELKKLSLDTGLKIPKIIDMWTKSPQAKELIKTNLNIKKWINKGQASIENIWIILIFMAVIGGFFLLYFVYSLFAPLIVTFLSEGNNMIADVTNSGSNDGVGEAYSAPSRIVSGITSSLEIVSYVSFFLILIAFVVLAFNVSNHQWLIGVWIVFIICMTGMGIVLSNSYQEFSTGLLANEYKSWAVNDFIMRNYPYLIAGFGFVLGIFLFIIGFRPVDNSYTDGGNY